MEDSDVLGKKKEKEKRKKEEKKREREKEKRIEKRIRRNRLEAKWRRSTQVDIGSVNLG